MKKILLLLVCCLELYGCKGGYKLPVGLPTKNNLMNKAPKGPPDFQYGWTEGCASGAAYNSSTFYVDAGTLSFRKDFQYAADHPDYEVGWQMAFYYCGRIAEKQDGIGGGKSAGIW